MIHLGPAQTSPFQEVRLFSHKGISHSVFSSGEGPGIILMHELPGMTEEFWRLANWLSEHFTVWAPDLFGASDEPTPADPNKLFFKACISREIHLFAKNDPGPISQWLRALSQDLHVRTGGPGIGAIGMCMTGNFALSLALDPWVVAPVCSQPALPAKTPFGRNERRLQMTPDEQRILKDRDVDVMALRFEGDQLCRAARFEVIRELVGDDRLNAHVIADEHRSPDGPLKFPHSVLTADLVDADESVTKQKLCEVIEFLGKRLTI